MEHSPLRQLIRHQLDGDLGRIEEILNADVMSIYSPIVPGLESLVRRAVEAFPTAARRDRLTIVLTTPGGVVEVVERMVRIIRHHYGEVLFVIPDAALSAGTVFAMSGDEILMDYSSCLGPIDPQLQKENRLVPALAYLHKVEELRTRAAEGRLTTVDAHLLSKLDLAELEQFEQAKQLSVTLLQSWLTSYKFKNWTVTQDRREPVCEEMKRTRAKEIADKLNNHKQWHSHGRGIGMDTLREELKLVIRDFGEEPLLSEAVRDYFALLSDFMHREGVGTFVHTRHFF